MHIIVSVTGHRPNGLLGYSDSAYVPLTDALVRVFGDCLRLNGQLTVRTGGAQGADMLGFRAASALVDSYGSRVRRELKLPFPGQEAGWKSDYGLFGRRQYRADIDAADDVHWTCQERPNNVVAALMNRNTDLVDGSHLVVAVVNEVEFDMDVNSFAQGRGGTTDAVRKALKRHIPIIAVSPSGRIRNWA